MNAAEPVRFDAASVIVTGGGRGLGRATALLIGSRGANVVIADNGGAKNGEGFDPGPASTVADEIIAQGGNAVACPVDLASDGGAAAVVEACMSAFGRVDAIAHFASPCPDLAPPDRIDLAAVDLVLRVNVRAGLALARAAWHGMAARGSGRILFASSAGLYGARHNADYSSAKAGVMGMMRCLAVDGAEVGIAVNAIAPAAATRMTDGFHPGAFADWFATTMTVDCVAPVAAYLLSSQCRESGQLFAVGGGRLARIALAEAEGVQLADGTPEAVSAAMARVCDDSSWFYPSSLAERTARVAGIMGYGGDG